MARIYIAAASAEIERTARTIAAARAAGHTITHDWTAIVRATTAPLSYGKQQTAATDDVRGINAAEIFWLLSPSTPTAGAWFELGYAYRAALFSPGVRVISSGPIVSIFQALAFVEIFPDDDTALASITVPSSIGKPKFIWSAGELRPFDGAEPGRIDGYVPIEFQYTDRVDRSQHFIVYFAGAMVVNQAVREACHRLDLVYE